MFILKITFLTAGEIGEEEQPQLIRTAARQLFAAVGKDCPGT